RPPRTRRHRDAPQRDVRSGGPAAAPGARAAGAHGHRGRGGGGGPVPGLGRCLVPDGERDRGRRRRARAMPPRSRSGAAVAGLPRNAQAPTSYEPHGPEVRRVDGTKVIRPIDGPRARYARSTAPEPDPEARTLLTCGPDAPVEGEAAVTSHG